MKVITFVRGLTIGFILGVLFAPDRGSATRRKLANTVSDIKDDMSDTCDDITAAVSRTTRNVRNKVKDTVDDLRPDTSGISSEGI